MTRLKTLPPLVPLLAPRLAPMPKLTQQFYLSPEWRRLLAKLKHQRGAWCQNCGPGRHRTDRGVVPLRGARLRLIGDHLVELSDGGAPLDPANVKLICQGCHNLKTAAAQQKRAGGGRVIA